MNNSGKIREHMEVIACCGTHVGEVDSVENNSIKMTKNDPNAGGQHHFIPCDWVDHVDEHVYLKRNSDEVFKEWKAESTFA